MLELSRRAAASAAHQYTLTLPFDRRQKSRLRAVLDAADGLEAAIELERGTFLKDGDRLLAATGEVVLVRAQPELVSVARSPDGLLLARAAYHLGNRHVPLQLLDAELRYQHDHVLDGMVRQLGLEVTAETLPFEPEASAYGAGHSHLSRGRPAGGEGGHSHGHGHAHDDHVHGHEHGHSHGHDPTHGHGHDHDHGTGDDAHEP